MPRFLKLGVFLLPALAAGALNARAGTLTVELPSGGDVTFVGAFQRWDQDGNLRKPVNPKAAIERPEVDATAVRDGENRWVFKDLKPGKYDLVILAKGRVRIEGWEYAPVLEFDPFFPATATAKPDAREFIVDDIKKSRHYENKVEPWRWAATTRRSACW